MGASERARWPSEISKNLREFGFCGRISLVNPRQTEVFGQQCFPSLRALPEPVDHALVIPYAAALVFFIWFAFDYFMAVPWPPTLMGEWFPALKAIPSV